MTLQNQLPDQQQPAPAKARRRRRAGVFLANLITIGVGGAAGYVSWQHLSHLGEKYGATQAGAFLTPFTIDGAIVVGTLELRQARIEGRPAKPWAYIAVLLGVVGTIAGNVAAAPSDALGARLYFAAPAMAFLISVEVLFGKPLSRNLWESIRGWRSARPAEPAEAAATIKAAEAEKPVEAPEKPVAATTPLLVPALPARPRTPATRKPAPAATAKKSSGKRPVGTRQRPERMVETGVVLAGPDLQADARARVSQALADGRKRDGLGAWVARQYDPPMSDRWGLDRVAEVRDVAEVRSPEPEPLIAPLPVAEEAVLITDREPATV